MTATNQGVLEGTPYVRGSASAILLAANLELSFWGGVNPKTGEVIDRFHPLSGRLLRDTIVAIPSGRGSCGGSIIMMELILNGLGPKAFIFERREEIITLGIFVADEFFKATAPVVTVGRDNFQKILGWNGQTVHILNNLVSLNPLHVDPTKDLTHPEDNLDNLGIELSDFDRATLAGVYGEAAKVSMKVIIRQAHMMGARCLMDVSQAHVDGAWYGPASVAFGKKLRDWGGKFQVPTTINSLNVDQKRWRALGIETDFGAACDELTEAFTDMGGKISFTCAPYLLDSAPQKGDPIAWGESNAVIYANSVLGARTLKNPNMLECLIALTGRAPMAGVYLDENRLAEVWIKVTQPPFIDDSYWPILGYSLGAVASNRIPVITGLENLRPSVDDFKAFSAAFATASSAAMFHMVGLTPEAPTLESTCSNSQALESIDSTFADLKACWEEFNSGSVARKVDLISFGNPHFSFKEIKKVAELCEGRTKHRDVKIMVTCGRAQYSLAAQAGYVAQLEAFGTQFLTDTCWCSIEEPVIPKQAEVIMTNSGKYIHYGPGLTGRQFCFGSLDMCIHAACSGWTTGEPPLWLRLLQIVV
ncbi:unnamed protein product [Clonostachys byssicola]|uniref:DUF521 domain protein n=1 Tax=Clonostachys byssicola TaxID=160290 RepID=A0A9N9V0M0_9HYPO|nr:unnamed protein product [Clonostachys byssicola]